MQDVRSVQTQYSKNMTNTNSELTSFGMISGIFNMGELERKHLLITSRLEQIEGKQFELDFERNTVQHIYQRLKMQRLDDDKKLKILMPQY